MDKLTFDKIFRGMIKEVKSTRDSGQKEYAHTEDNVFANFERVAEGLNISREQALMVYLMKHIDGINAWIKGHKSQREDVSGRIKDSIVYLCLLWGMSEEHDQNIDAFFDEHGFTPTKTPNGSKFNPATGEVSYQSLGDETV
jgi:hypothetical protein|tara:strand:- start:354 stop:779 length:426 start_codon:yes stop_codon:yes gene_type:complete